MNSHQPAPSAAKATTKEDIITLPNPHLRQRSRKVGLITAQIKRLADDMEAAVHDWDASRPHEVTVALAAIQIDVPLRVVIVRDNFDAKVTARYSTLINPEITKYEGEIESDFEGCLSIKSVYGKVPRHTKIRVRALDIDGKEIHYKADGFLARVLQHEIDHTNGIVFVDHIKDNQAAFFELDKDGKLEPLDYDQDIQNSRILW